jgi:hypothetical protein
MACLFGFFISDAEKSFMTLKPGGNVTKLFFLVADEKSQ